MSEFTRSRVGAASYLVAAGSLVEARAVDALRAELEGCLERREHKIVLDLSEVPLIGSAALEALLDQQELLARQGGSIRVVNANGVLRDAFHLTGLDKRLVLELAQGDAARPEASASGAPHQRIGELLLERGLVKPETIDDALALQAETGLRMAEILVNEGWLAERDLLETLSFQLGVPSVNLRSGLYDLDVVRQVDAEVARRLDVLALFRVRGVLYLATPDPQSIPAMDTVADLTGCRVEPVLACRDEIRSCIEEAYGEALQLSEFIGDIEGDIELVEGRNEDQEAIDEMAAGSPVIKLINGVIQRAVMEGASDIHIEPSRRHCRIRMRVDGVLHALMSPPIEVHPALISRLKVMARLDIAERRLPQDGRIQVFTGGRNIDLRFSSLPGIFGEKIVLRVLDKSESYLDIAQLGMTDANRETFERLLARSYGLLLVTGPTGAGKTTTLYAAVSHLDSPEKNIVTIEDPVEYQLDSINQNQVNDAIGLDFARFLKHVLRQDPDIVMVGEIRERETAEIAVQAALTGHLVLSTLHTNDSAGAITRLVDMGVEPFLLSSALVGVVAQRLVRGVCAACRTSYAAPAGALDKYGVESEGQIRLVRGRGCAACFDSGYKERFAIHEILESDASLQRLVIENPDREAIDRHLAERGMRTLLHDGVGRAIEGRTTVEEVLRVVNS